MKTRTYRIILQPVDWYFFGSEQTFGEGKTSRYFAKSNTLPQQTSVLGMLRYQILKQNNLLATGGHYIDYSSENIKRWIGERSFCVKDKIKSFGIIDWISPVLICRIEGEKCELFYPTPMGQQCDYTFEDARVCLNGVEKNELICASSFDVKNAVEYESKWASNPNPDTFLSDSDIFIQMTQIGIRKNTDSEVLNKKAFYKKAQYKLNGGFNFIFNVTLTAEDSFVLESDLVYLGAERSCFNMTVNLIDENFGKYEFISRYPIISSDENRIVLISDAYVDDLEKLNQYSLFYWSDSLPFRNFRTRSSSKTDGGGTMMSKVDMRYTFLKRGTVIFFKSENKEKIRQLLSVDFMQKIGYNIFK